KHAAGTLKRPREIVHRFSTESTFLRSNDNIGRRDIGKETLEGLKSIQAVLDGWEACGTRRRSGRSFPTRYAGCQDCPHSVTGAEKPLAQRRDVVRRRSCPRVYHGHLRSERRRLRSPAGGGDLCSGGACGGSLRCVGCTPSQDRLHLRL